MASLDDIKRVLDRIDSELVDIVRKSQIDPSQIVVVEGLSDISKRLGLIQAGEFRAGTPVEPGLGFSGVRIGYPAFSYNGEDWHIVGVENDRLQFGLRASDGKALAAEGLITIDNEGLTFASEGIFMQMAASYPPGRVGWFLGGLLVTADGGITHKFGLHSFHRNGSALIDDDFESGDLSGWTKTGSPSATTDQAAAGTYSAAVDDTNYISQDVSVTVDHWYVLAVKVRLTNTDTVLANPFGSGSWSYMPAATWTLLMGLYKAPSSGTLTLALKGSGSTSTLYVDDVYFYETDQFSYMGTNQDGEGSFDIRSGVSGSGLVRIGTAADRDVLTVSGGGSTASTVTVKKGLVVNSIGGDYDSHVEGDTDQNLTYWDAGNDRVGIGTASPGYKLDVGGDINIASGSQLLLNGADYVKLPIVANAAIAPVPGSTTYFLLPFSATFGTATNLNAVIPIAGTLSNFKFVVTGTQPASGSLVATVYVNNVASAMTATVPSGTSGTLAYEDTTHTVSLAEGDRVKFVFQNNATSNSINVAAVSLIFSY